MIRLLALGALLAAPAQAMTPEDCKRLQATMAKAVPAVAEVRLARDVTDDGWCRVIDSPVGAGLEWRLSLGTSEFDASVRQDGFEYEGLGPFTLNGSASRSDDRFVVGPFRLLDRAGDAIVVEAQSPTFTDMRAGAETAGLERASLTVAGEDGLVNDILAWAFRQDVRAARSSLIAARDQRNEMLNWLESEASGWISSASTEAFRRMVQAYPRAKGVAQIAIREDKPVQISGLVSAVLFGSDFSRQEAQNLVKAAGLRFTWSPG